MQRENKSPFPYYVGARTLEDLANKDTRVCVVNILGGESSKVTPVSHAYSRGNVVAGVQYGRSGSKLETPIGDIPVWGSVKEVIDKGIRFDTGVIYLPPAAVSHAVSEMCAINPDIRQIVVISEKLSVRDSRYIRYGAQQRGIDVIGANTLGVANAWDQVRVGGALGGDKPHESLIKGSIAIYSNSGNFSTTMAEYLKTAGFGVSTVLSSGKDIYIHFALPEFLYCAENDPRTKAVVVYIEPGGYYEKMALDWIREGLFKFTKPIIAVVTGRWKKHLTRAVGHAGAIAGAGDDAEAKEQIFDEYFGVPEFNVENPKVSPRGVRVASIQDIPVATAAVMESLGHKPDFAPIGDLSLKPWFVNDMGIVLPKKLALQPVKAMSPYDIEIEEANKQVGAQYIRESMRNKSGASYMDPKTQVTNLHDVSLLNLVKHPFSAVTVFAVTKVIPDDANLNAINPILNYFTHVGTKNIDIAVRGRKNGASPNAYIGASVLVTGNNPMYQALSSHASKLIDLFYTEIGRKTDINNDLIQQILNRNPEFMTESGITDLDERLAANLQKALTDNSHETIFTRFAVQYNEKIKGNANRPNPHHLLIAAVLLSLAWKPLTEKRITRKDAEDLGVYLAVNGAIVGASAVNHETNEFWKSLNSLSDLSVLSTDFAETCFRVLFSRKPTESELFAYNSLLNLTVTNGPGTISAKGAKESVSAKNHIATAFGGFMMNTGFAHGGNGYEAVEFLIKEFGDTDPYEAGRDQWEKILSQLADRVSTDYVAYKKQAKAKGELDYKKIPCTNHPVFKGNPVNIDPREDYVRDLLGKKGIVNPFLEFYHHLVVKLHEKGATPNVFCVNIDAVIATISLELFWKEYRAGKIKEDDMKDIVFTMFLFGRMVGSSAEIADHRNRGTDMDCRTPASELAYVK